MAIPNEFKEFFSVTWYYDDNTQEKYSVQRLNQNYKIVNNRIILNEIPDEDYGVLISGLYEIPQDQSITDNTLFKVNYLNGQVTFHPSKEGQTVTVVEYYAKGSISYYAQKVLLQDTNNHWTSDNLEDLMEEIYQRFISDEANLTNHINSTTAHALQNITYSPSGGSGSINDVAITEGRKAVEYVNNRISNIISSPIATAQEVVDARPGINGESNTVLKDRLDKIENTNQITSISANTTLTLAQRGLIHVTTGSNTITVTLPSAATTRIRYIIKKIDSGSGIVSIVTTSSQLIDGKLTRIIGSQYESLCVVSTGTGWTVENLNENYQADTSTLSIPSGIATVPANAEINSPAAGVVVEGNTRTNPVQYSNMDTDTDGNGVVNDFSTYVGPDATAVFSFDATEKAQKIEITSSTTGEGRTAQVISNFSNYIPVTPGQVISVSVYAKVSGNVGCGVGLSLFNSSKGYVTATARTHSTNTSYNQIKFENYTVPANIYYVRIICEIKATSGGSTGSGWFKNTMIDPFSTAGSYIQSGTRSALPCRVRSINKNLADNINKYRRIDSGWNLDNTRYAYSAVKFNSASALTAIIEYYRFKVLPNTQYTLSIDMESALTAGSFESDWFEVDVSGNWFVDGIGISTGGSYSLTRYSKTFTTQSNTVEIYLRVFVTNAIGIAWASKIMLSAGTNTSYEEKKVDDAYIDWTNGEARRVGTVADKFDVASGIETVNDAKDTTVFKTITSWGTTSELTNTIMFRKYNAFFTDLKQQVSSTDISNTKLVVGNLVFNPYAPNLLYPSDVEGICYTTDGYISVRILKSRLSTVDTAGFEAFLQANTVTLLYQFATPLTYEHTPQSLVLTPGGTVQVEPGVFRREYRPSTGVITIPEASTYPIYAVESVKKAIIVGGKVEYQEVGYSAFNATTVTPNSVDNNAQYLIIWSTKPELSTVAPATVTYCKNIKASDEANSNNVARISEWVNKTAQSIITKLFTNTWTTWTPTLTWTTGTPGGSVVTIARYTDIGKVVYFNFYYSATDGNGATALKISLPRIPKDNNSIISVSAQQKQNTTWANRIAYIDDDDNNGIQFRDFATCTDAQAVEVIVSGFYEID